MVGSVLFMPAVDERHHFVEHERAEALHLETREEVTMSGPIASMLSCATALRMAATKLFCCDINAAQAVDRIR